MRNRKCKFCGVADTPSIDMQELNLEGMPASDKGFYHVACVPTYMQTREVLNEENKQKNELNDTIKKIYGIAFVPNFMWILFNDLHAGITNKSVVSLRLKPPKKGIAYEVMTEAYRLSAQPIRYMIEKGAVVGTENQLKYGYKVMYSKLNDAYINIKNKNKAVTKHEMTKEVDISSEDQVQYVKKDRHVDMSGLLD